MGVRLFLKMALAVAIGHAHCATSLAQAPLAQAERAFPEGPLTWTVASDLEVRATFDQVGSTVESSTPQQFSDYILSESSKWTNPVRARNIKREPGT
ncbi:MAG: hypothetical protein V4731_10335 [Pseudomonadota bacterium]